MTTIKHCNPNILGHLLSNTHGLVAHVVEYRPKGSKDSSAWVPIINSSGYGQERKVGLVVPYDVSLFEWGNVYGAVNARDAADKMKLMATCYGEELSFRITRYPMSQEAADEIIANNCWKEREASRLKDGTYTLCPWAGEAWWEAIQERYNHFAHVSDKKKGLIAFTSSNAQGLLDRHEVMLPGRYLSEFGQHMNLAREYLWNYVPTGTNVHGGQVDTLRLELLAQDFTLKHGSRSVLQFAETGEQMEYVYIHGPNSCMSLRADQYVGSCHPVRVYAAGDLKLAYLTSHSGDENAQEEHITARALVWPERKAVGRVYGDVYTLKALLKAEGYDVSQDNWYSLEGAKLLKIEATHGYVMPYIDGSHTYSTHDDPKFFMLGGGENSAGYTSGVDYDPDDYEENNDEDSGAMCERCEETYDPDDGVRVIVGRLGGAFDHVEVWCNRCYENHTYVCDASGNLYSDEVDNILTGEGRTISTNNADYYILDAITGEYWHCDNIAGTYNGDEDDQVSKQTVRDEWLVWHEATSSYYKPDCVPQDTDTLIPFIEKVA